MCLKREHHCPWGALLSGFRIFPLPVVVCVILSQCCMKKQHCSLWAVPPPWKPPLPPPFLFSQTTEGNCSQHSVISYSCYPVETCFKESNKDCLVLKGSKNWNTFYKIFWLHYLNVHGVCLGKLQRNGWVYLSGRKGGRGKESVYPPLCEIPQDFSLCIIYEYLCIISEYLPKEMW